MKYTKLELTEIEEFISKLNDKSIKKVTKKKFIEIAGMRDDLHYEYHAVDRNYYQNDGVSETELINYKMRCRKLSKVITEKYIDKLPKVNLSYYIGSRSYWSEVTKIGKSYYESGFGVRAINKTHGYHGITEVAEITEDNRAEMLSDSYYY